MKFEFNGPAKLARDNKKQSLIILEAKSEKEAQWKLKRYIAIGVSMKWYLREDNNRA